MAGQKPGNRSRIRRIRPTTEPGRSHLRPPTHQRTIRQPTRPHHDLKPAPRKNPARPPKPITAQLQNTAIQTLQRTPARKNPQPTNRTSIPPRNRPLQSNRTNLRTRRRTLRRLQKSTPTPPPKRTKSRTTRHQQNPTRHTQPVEPTPSHHA